MSEAQETSSSIFSFLQGQVLTPQKLTVRSTEVHTADGPVVHAIDGSGRPTLLVPVASYFPNSIDWQNKLVSFGYRTITVAGRPQSFLALQCLAERVQPQFSLLADDVLDAVSTSPSAADSVTRQTVERWKELLRDDKPHLLGPSQLGGLYGELLFLEQLVFHHGPWVVRSWTGPLGNRHDFEFANASFEIKTTRNNNGLVVTFHGARQLENANDNPLYVAAYQIESSPQGDSIPTVLERLYESGLGRADMLKLLQRIGYYESDSGHYAALRFSVLATKTLVVDDSFPRITHDTMPMPGMLDGISSLQYSVDLGVLEAIEIRLEGLQEVESS